MSGKIHRATVTRADLYYVGSLIVDEALMGAADLVEGEQVQVVDIDDGSRLTTYVITGERHSCVIGINGAGAHLINRGDLTIIMSFQQEPTDDVANYGAEAEFNYLGRFCTPSATTWSSAPEFDAARVATRRTSGSGTRLLSTWWPLTRATAPAPCSRRDLHMAVRGARRRAGRRAAQRWIDTVESWARAVPTSNNRNGRWDLPRIGTITSIRLHMTLRGSMF